MKVRDENERKKLDASKVAEYMSLLKHPLKSEIEAVREIVKNSDARISERIKWNAPSYYYKVDLLTFNPRLQSRVHLVFHNQAIVNVPSAMLEGEYKDRRMMYFDSMADVIARKAELERIIHEYLNQVE